MASSLQTPLQRPIKIGHAGHVVDLNRRALLDACGRPIELRPQAYDVLRLLALHAGQLVTKEELLAEVWPDVVVTDDSLVQAIGDVRQALGAAGHQVLKTIPRRGYLLLSTDETVQPAAPPTAPASIEPPPPPHRPIWVALTVTAALLLSLGLSRSLWMWWTPHSPPALAAASGRLPSVAVLAFKGPVGEADAEALAQDVAAELASELARSPDLRVVSSQSSFQFAHQPTLQAEIGQRLRSRYLVDGTVRRTGDALRLTVELIDSQEGQILWSSASTVDRGGLGAAQQAWASRIAGTLQSGMVRSEQRRALSAPPQSLDAYVLVARGSARLRQYNGPAVREARQLFQQALALEPDYAAAWVFLGLTNVIDIGAQLTGEWGYGRVDEVLVQIRRGIELQPEFPKAYFALAQAHVLADDHKAMLAAAQRLCVLSPNDADCFYTLGSAQMRLGDEEQAVRNFALAVDRNPLTPAHYSAFSATALWGTGRLDEALHATDDCLAKAPGFWRCRQDRIAVLVDMGRLPQAREEAGRLRTQMPHMTAQQFGAGFAATATSLRDRRVAAARAAGFP